MNGTRLEQDSFCEWVQTHTNREWKTIRFNFEAPTNPSSPVCKANPYRDPFSSTTTKREDCLAVRFLFPAHKYFTVPRFGATHPFKCPFAAAVVDATVEVGKCFYDVLVVIVVMVNVK